MLFRDLSPPKTCWHFSRMRWKIQERAFNYLLRETSRSPEPVFDEAFQKHPEEKKKKKSTEKKEISLCCATPSYLAAPSNRSPAWRRSAVISVQLEPVPAVVVLCHSWLFAKPGRKEEHIRVWGPTRGTSHYKGTGACWQDKRLPLGLWHTEEQTAQRGRWRGRVEMVVLEVVVVVVCGVPA